MLNLKDVLDIFICTHKDFEPIVSNEVYKLVNCNDINNDTWNDIKGSFYSEIMTYFYVAEHYELKDYVGFCHYRKYWAFMDDVPNIDEVIQDQGIIAAKPILFKNSVRMQYHLCHNIEDLYIVSGILAEEYPEYVMEWNHFLDSNTLIPYNMFIMRREEFLEYVKFIKNILDKYVFIVGKDIEKRITSNKDKYLKKFSPNDKVWYQFRIGGYLAERLTNVWILKNHKRIAVADVNITEKKY